MIPGIIKMTKDEYREGYLCVRTCKITFLGIPIYRSKITTTNNDALRKLTVLEESQLHVVGFN